MKVLSVFGTRPEAIKMAPVLRALHHHPEIESKLCVTAQHREMLDQVLRPFGVQPDYDLNLMRQEQSLSDITCDVLKGLEPVLDEEKPDLLLVHGDTTTTYATAMAAFYRSIPCAHVEAGLRSGSKYSPYPEEMNRRLISQLTALHFAPTNLAKKNLLAEGVPEDWIHVTGNTVIDALFSTLDQPCNLEHLGLDSVDWEKKIILFTCHRRENWGEPMLSIFAAVRDFLDYHPDFELIFPVHKNPKVRELAYQELGGHYQIHFCEPLDYLPMCHIMQRCYLVLTDSGGLQEEAPALAKPVLVLRDTTERPEAVESGTALLAGTGYYPVLQSLRLLAEHQQVYNNMAQAVNPYGDGHAAERIVDIILNTNIKKLLR